MERWQALIQANDCHGTLGTVLEVAGSFPHFSELQGLFLGRLSERERFLGFWPGHRGTEQGGRSRQAFPSPVG